MNELYATGEKEIAAITAIAAKMWSEIDLGEAQPTKRDLCVAAFCEIKKLESRIRELEATLAGRDALIIQLEKRNAKLLAEQVEFFEEEESALRIRNVRIAKLEELVNAIEAETYGGLYLNGFVNKSWFYERDDLLTHPL